MSQIDEAKERRLFEDACYAYYQKRAAAGEVDTRDAGDGSREALFWRHPDGTYGVQMFNAAWFGWRERALLAVQQAAQQAGVESLPTKITEEMHVAACKVLTRAHGLAGTPQRMLDAMRAAAPQPARVGTGKTAEQAIAQWDHDFANPMTPEQAEDFARRERAFAVQQAAGGAAHPMQPIELVGGVARFKKNAMVCHLLDWAQPRGMGMNEMAAMDFSPEDWMQFAQLIGYSVGGYGELSYVTDESYDAAASMVSDLLKPAQQPSQKPAPLCDCKGRFYDRCESAWEPYCVLGKSSEHAILSKAVMPKPNVHMDGYVRTDRPNGDGL